MSAPCLQLPLLEAGAEVPHPAEAPAERQLEHLPQEVRNNEHMRVYAGKDTYAAGRLVQKWRKPTNRISQGKLLTKETAATAFHIGIDDVNKCVNETIQLIKDGKHLLYSCRYH